MSNDNKAIIDQYNFVPTGGKEESNESFILMDTYVNPKAVKACAEGGITPAFVGKAIGKWDVSRFGYDIIAIEALSFLKDRVKAISKMWHNNLSNSFDANKPIFRNVDFKELTKRCGWDVSAPDEWMKKILEECSDVQKDKDSRKTCAFIAKMIRLHSFTAAISEHDEELKSFKHPLLKNINLDPQPDVDDLEKTIAIIGLGQPKFFGDMNFFGWDGKPESLESINPEALIEEDGSTVVDTPTAPVMVTLAAFREQGKSSPFPVCLLSVFDDPSHRNWREMNWHLDKETFEKHPVSNGKKLEDFFYSSKTDNSGDMWLGKNKELDYFRNEGLFMETKMAGAVLLGPNFHSFASEIARSTSLFPDEKDAEGLPANIWVNAISRYAGRLISKFGLTSAAIIEEFVVGYFATPFLYSASNDEVNDGGEDSMMNLVKEHLKDNSPADIMELHPIFKKATIALIGEKGEEYNDYVSYLNLSVFPHFTREEVESELNKAIVKLATIYDRAENTAVFSKGLGVKKFNSSEIKGDDGNPLIFTNGGFDKALDTFAEDKALDAKTMIKRRLQMIKDMNVKLISE